MNFQVASLPRTTPAFKTAQASRNNAPQANMFSPSPSAPSVQFGGLKKILQAKLGLVGQQDKHDLKNITLAEAEQVLNEVPKSIGYQLEEPLRIEPGFVRNRFFDEIHAEMKANPTSSSKSLVVPDFDYKKFQNHRVDAKIERKFYPYGRVEYSYDISIPGTGVSLGAVSGTTGGISPKTLQKMEKFQKKMEALEKQGDDVSVNKALRTVQFFMFTSALKEGLGEWLFNHFGTGLPKEDENNGYHSFDEALLPMASEDLIKKWEAGEYNKAP